MEIWRGEEEKKERREGRGFIVRTQSGVARARCLGGDTYLSQLGLVAVGSRVKVRHQSQLGLVLVEPHSISTVQFGVSSTS